VARQVLHEAVDVAARHVDERPERLARVGPELKLAGDLRRRIDGRRLQRVDAARV
jgi:hypothetical protein